MAELQNDIAKQTIQGKETTNQQAEKSQIASKELANSGAVRANDEKDILEGMSTWVVSKIAWLIIPGSTSIYKIINEIENNALNVISGLTSKIPSFIGGLITKATLTIAPKLASLYLTQSIMENLLRTLPVVTICISSLIVSIGYIVTLTKYFYISPFVVAFALSTKQLDKITQFLISGITIFLQPILIILFIYLSLFINTLISEFFILIGSEQFAAIPLNMTDYTALLLISRLYYL